MMENTNRIMRFIPDKVKSVLDYDRKLQRIVGTGNMKNNKFKDKAILSKSPYLKKINTIN